MITVHHLEYSQSFRALWLLEELGAEYELKFYPRDPESNLAPADYKAISPLGTAPVVTDGDKVIAESNAVIDYILDAHPESPLRPAPGDPARDKYLFWFHACQGSMMPMLFTNMIFDFVSQGAPFLVKPVMKKTAETVRGMLIEPRLGAILDQAEKDLAAHQWLTGDELTAADIAMCYTMQAAEQRGFVGDAQPGCQRWIRQAAERTAFQAAKAKDGGREMLFTLGE
ncbi:MAG: glutathione S-transferase family protein [Parasphingopyxis sp.]|uniref:glutathione S-transferase family protein n=1 Tax=Parasphingopyxis sp. TaxID=1920299 RepID=UPI0032EF0141